MSGRAASAALSGGAAALRKAGIPGPERDARDLLAHVCGLSPLKLRVSLNELSLSAEQEAAFDAAIEARADRQPVAQIIGQRAFWGRMFRVTPDVLDPRPETETLVAEALKGRPGARVLDLGTGSGVLAITLAAEWPDARVVATDVSEPALRVARENAERHGVAERISFQRGSWFETLSGRYDVIVSNPPYIAITEYETLDPDVRRYEPKGALTPGGDGLDAYRQIASGLGQHLETGGRAYFEFGAGQAQAVQSIFANYGWTNSQIIRDLSNKERILVLQSA